MSDRAEEPLEPAAYALAALPAARANALATFSGIAKFFRPSITMLMLLRENATSFRLRKLLVVLHAVAFLLKMILSARRTMMNIEVNNGRLIGLGIRVNLPAVMTYRRRDGVLPVTEYELA